MRRVIDDGNLWGMGGGEAGDERRRIMMKNCWRNRECVRVLMTGYALDHLQLTAQDVVIINSSVVAAAQQQKSMEPHKKTMMGWGRGAGVHTCSGTLRRAACYERGTAIQARC